MPAIASAGREPGLADGLGRDGPVDALLDLGVEWASSRRVRCRGVVAITGILAHGPPAPVSRGIVEPRDLAPGVGEGLAEPARG